MKVTLRKRATENGFSLFLDIVHNGQRQKEYLNLHIKNGAKYKEENKQTLELAEKIREKRSLELKSTNFDFIADHKKKILFIEYYEKAIKEKKAYTYNNTLNYIKQYVKGTLYLTNINNKWVKGFQAYLQNQKLNPNSINLYLTTIITILKSAKKDNLISEIPVFEYLKGKQYEKVFLT